MKNKNGETSTWQGRGSENFSQGNKQAKDTSKSAAFAELRELFLKEHRHKYPAIPDSYRVIPKFEDHTTNGLTKCVLTFLKLSGCQAERINSQGRVIDTRRTVTDVIGIQRTIGSIKRIPTNGQRGTADISATIRGRSVKVEIKCAATGDRQRPAQAEYQRQVEQAGGLYVIASSFPQFYQWYVSKFGR